MSELPSRHDYLLALLKYLFYYIIRSGFGKFFGKIHVLTRHLHPNLTVFDFVLDFGVCCILTENWTFSEMFWRRVTTGLRWRIRRRARTRKMEPKGARRSLGRPAWSPFQGPIGLNFLQREVLVNPSRCFTKTIDQSHLYMPRSCRQEGGEHPETISRDPFELDTRERRHRRPHHPSAPLQVGGQQGIHPLPQISSPWSTTLRLTSWG